MVSSSGRLEGWLPDSGGKLRYKRTLYWRISSCSLSLPCELLLAPRARLPVKTGSPVKLGSASSNDDSLLMFVQKYFIIYTVLHFKQISLINGRIKHPTHMRSACNSNALIKHVCFRHTHCLLNFKRTCKETRPLMFTRSLKVPADNVRRLIVRQARLLLACACYVCGYISLCKRVYHFFSSNSFID